jgi:NTE family protein
MAGGWDPAAVRERAGLALSGAEREAIGAKLVPDPEVAGVYAADAVFEGGGVLGLAFLGAARCCHDAGIRWRNLAGTSAGAITAAFLASEMSVEEIEATLGALDFAGFLSRKTSRWIWDNDPTDDLKHAFRMFANLLLARRPGQYSTGPFHDWLAENLARGRVERFGPLLGGANGALSRLKVVVSDVTHGQMLVLPDDLDDAARADFPVAEAVRLSMSIPFFFEPGRLPVEALRRDGSLAPCPEGAVVVDGGILSNFPVWLFDAVVGERPRWPTFGFRLVDRARTVPYRVTGPVALAVAMFETMRTAHDSRHLSARKRNRTVDIDLTEVIVKHKLSVTSFTLSDAAKDDLYRAGYESTKRFLLEEWDWGAHLRSRGFGGDARGWLGVG